MSNENTTAQPLADAAAKFIAQNTPAPRADGKPHKKAPAKRARKRTKKTRAKKAKPASKPRVKSSVEFGAPQVGDKIERVYKGVKHSITCVEGGFKYQGATFTSLTALAKKITGRAGVNGPQFFGFWKPAAK